MCECRECVSVCVWADAGACHARGPDAHDTGGKCVCVCVRECVYVCVYGQMLGHATPGDLMRMTQVGSVCVCACVCVCVCVC